MSAEVFLRLTHVMSSRSETSLGRQNERFLAAARHDKPYRYLGRAVVASALGSRNDQSPPNEKGLGDVAPKNDLVALSNVSGRTARIARQREDCKTGLLRLQRAWEKSKTEDAMQTIMGRSHNARAPSTPTIMVIDDETTFLALMDEVLTDLGYLSLKSACNEQALPLIHQTNPAAIVLDIYTGQPYSGWELLRHLRHHPATAQIPVIICSTDATLRYAHSVILKQRQYTFLAKPFMIEALAAQLTAVVGAPLQAA